MLKLTKHNLKIITSVLVWLISLNLAILFIRNGWRKFDPEGFWTNAFTKWGYPLWFMFLIGVLEFGGGIAILIPRVASFGGIALAVVMIGALVTRLIHGVSTGDVISIISFMVTALFIAVYWIKYNPFVKVVNGK